MNEDKFVSLRQLENLDDLNSELNNLNRRNFTVSRYTHSELKHMHYIPKIDFEELKEKLNEDGYIEYVLKQKSKFKNLMKKAKSLNLIWMVLSPLFLKLMKKIILVKKI